MRKRKNEKISDAVEILHRRYVRGDVEKLAELESIRADDAVARKIYDLRTKSGLSQRALAKLVGTSASAICRLEDADYEGHSLAMLNRIAEALDRRVEIRFVPIRGARHPAATEIAPTRAPIGA
jgi:DNA-binding XRE family transcriptional regulator